MAIESGWYEDESLGRIFVAGEDSEGYILIQSDGASKVYCITPRLLALDKWTPLPDCSGWDWKKPVPVAQTIGGRIGADSWTGLRLWTVRTLSRGDRYVFIAAEKGANDWVEVVFDGTGWQIKE